MNACSRGYNRNQKMRKWVRSSTSRWVLALMLAAANFHLCTERFLLPDGDVCGTCPTLSREEAQKDTEVLVADDSHGDCHDCCTLKACDGEQADDAAARGAAPSVPVYALALAPISISIPVIEETPAIFALLEGHPPTGPPIEVSGRGPPAVS